MKFDFNEFIDKARKPKNEKFRNQLYVFLICFGISVSLWFLINLSKEYYSSIDYPIIYTNVPNNILLTNKVDSVLYLRIKSKGFNLISIKYFKRHKPVKINLGSLKLKKNGKTYRTRILTSKIAKKIAIQLNLSDKLISVSPDSLFF